VQRFWLPSAGAFATTHSAAKLPKIPSPLALQVPESTELQNRVSALPQKQVFPAGVAHSTGHLDGATSNYT
jgi:hypothetical protein